MKDNKKAWEILLEREEEYEKELAEAFPELMTGMEKYEMDGMGCCDLKNYVFNFCNYYDSGKCTKVFHYVISRDKSKFHLTYNGNCHVDSSDYNEFLAIRNKIIDGNIDFYRIPEFYCKLYFDTDSSGTTNLRYFCFGANSYSAGASSKTNSKEEMYNFIARCIPESYRRYSYIPDFTLGDIEHEKRVMRSAIKKETAFSIRRKRERLNRHGKFVKKHDLEIILEETPDYEFVLRIKGIENSEKIRFRTDITREELRKFLEGKLDRFYYESIKNLNQPSVELYD